MAQVSIPKPFDIVEWFAMVEVVGGGREGKGRGGEWIGTFGRFAPRPPIINTAGFASPFVADMVMIFEIFCSCPLLSLSRERKAQSHRRNRLRKTRLTELQRTKDYCFLPETKTPSLLVKDAREDIGGRRKKKPKKPTKKKREREREKKEKEEKEEKKEKEKTGKFVSPHLVCGRCSDEMEEWEIEVLVDGGFWIFFCLRRSRKRLKMLEDEEMEMEMLVTVTMMIERKSLTSTLTYIIATEVLLYGMYGVDGDVVRGDRCVR